MVQKAILWCFYYYYYYLALNDFKEELMNFTVSWMDAIVSFIIFLFPLATWLERQLFIYCCFKKKWDFLSGSLQIFLLFLNLLYQFALCIICFEAIYQFILVGSIMWSAFPLLRSAAGGKESLYLAVLWTISFYSVPLLF